MECLKLDPSNEQANSMMQNFNTDKKVVFTGKRFVKV